ncbi:MAG TPA: twin-arginine translocation pathway signal protein, partial [Opitutaceae bacterium]|nr:twin-arginine translocation pathway signal protein [Opitutaceae bacterium]
MKNPNNFLPTTRREFFRLTSRGIGLLAFSRFAPSFLVQSTLAATPAPEKDRTILVLVQLAGGNDGLNTVIPYEDSNYYRLRPTLGIPKEQILKIGDTPLGFHPAMTAMSGLLSDGKLAVVQNVGYPNPNRSHFRSTEIWETASDSSEYLPTGWIGRFMDNACNGSPAADADPCAVHITSGVPQSFLAGHDHNTFGLSPYGNGRRRENLELLEKLVDRPGAAENESASFLKQTMMDALVTEKRVQGVLGTYRPASTYPTTPFAASLR